jgi:CRISPR RNA silencing complex Cmr2 subunit-like protein
MQLLIVDTTGIQPYIFGSNRLRENLGASHLVAQATEDWALEILRMMFGARCNVQADNALDKTMNIESPANGLESEVVYAGGGNIVILFRDSDNQDKAKEFTGRLSRQALTDAPSLQLVIAKEPFDWSNDSLFEKVKATFRRLAELKRTRALSAPLLGLGVSVKCQSTGLSASEVTQPIGNNSGYPASAEIHAKLRVATNHNNQPSEAGIRLRTVLPPPSQYDYPGEFNDLGGSAGEHSYIAVVHADGNGMGLRIMDLGKAHASKAQNRDYINAMRDFSDAVEEASQKALKATLGKLVNRIKGDVIRHPNLPKLVVKLIPGAQPGSLFLPVRPIVFGGDDLTFVCDGRLGLSLAIEYLNQFKQHTVNLPDNQGAATACAGIAIVKSHYPFARAYGLAEDLCGSAKKYRREKNLNESCLDWHFAMSGLSGGIEVIRDREYKVSAGSLTLRPVTLDDNPREPQRSWEVVHKGVNAFQGQDWAGRGNKVKALRDALRGGSASIASFRNKFNETKPLPRALPNHPDLERTGWLGGFCGYFDAVEMIDWFFPL